MTGDSAASACWLGLRTSLGKRKAIAPPTLPSAAADASNTVPSADPAASWTNPVAASSIGQYPTSPSASAGGTYGSVRRYRQAWGTTCDGTRRPRHDSRASPPAVTVAVSSTGYSRPACRWTGPSSPWPGREISTRPSIVNRHPPVTWAENR